MSALAAQDIVLMNNAPLSGSFRASSWLAIQNREFTLDFKLVVAGAAASVEYYLEFSSNPLNSAVPVFREVAQEDGGGGQVLMPAVVRTFAENGGTTLPIGTHMFDTEYVRRHRTVRVQIRVTGEGASARATITAPFGLAVT